MEKLTNWWKVLVYSQRQAGVRYNRFTLSISDKKIAREVRLNQIREFNDLFWFANILAILNLL